MSVSIEDINIITKRIIDQADLLMDDTDKEAGWDFFLSVKEKANSIKANASEYKKGTTGQLNALTNMEKGLNKWVRN